MLWLLSLCRSPDNSAFAFGFGFALVFPLIYGVGGFLFTALGCAIYNMVAGWVGGIEVEADESAANRFEETPMAALVSGVRSLNRFLPERAIPFTLALALASVACDDGPTGDSGSIDVTVNPTALSVPQGGSGSGSAVLTRNGGFSGAVTLVISGLPAGVTTMVSPAQLSGTTTSATIGVTVAAAVALGTYTATITATAQGVGQVTTTFPLTVTAPLEYALSVTPASLSIIAGLSGHATINIARTSFNGAIALTLLNAPAGVTGVFNPTSATTNLSALVVSAAANVAAGNYQLTIQGSAPGVSNRTAVLQLTVTPPAAGGTNVEYQFCDPSEAPLFLAYQDGTSVWRAVTGTTGGGRTRFAFSLTQTWGGVLAVYRTTVPSGYALSAARRALRRRDQLRAPDLVARRPNASRVRLADIYQTAVLYASAAELAQDGSESCAGTQPIRTVTGTVTGVPAGAFSILSFGNTTEVFVGGMFTNPVAFEVPAGPNDFAGSRMTAPGTAPNRVVVFRNLNIPNGGSLPAPIDFNGSASSAPATASVNISGAAGDNLETFVDLVTLNSRVGLWFDLAPSSNTTRPWAGLSSTVMQSSDFHGLVVFATPPNNTADFRVALKYVGSVVNQDIALGPAVSLPATVAVALDAYPRFRFQGTLPAEYSRGAAIDVIGLEAFGNLFSMVATSTYLAAAGNPFAYDFTMPDVAGLAGFPAAARLTAGSNNLDVSMFGFTGPGIFDLRPTLGSEFRAALKNTTLIVP